MEIHKNPQKCMKIHGNARKFTKNSAIHENSPRRAHRARASAAAWERYTNSGSRKQDLVHGRHPKRSDSEHRSESPTCDH